MPLKNALLAPPSSSCDDPIVIDLMPPWMQEMRGNVLMLVQHLHDDEINWDRNGLTYNGKSQHQSILEALAEMEMEYS